MSIALTIKQLERDRALLPFEPLVKRPAHEQGARYLWLTPAAFDWCFPDNAHPDGRISGESLAHLEAQMSAFVRGEFVDWKDGIDIKRLDPPERDIWEIRSHLKKPQLRLFGWFALPKWFVATNYALRDDLEPQRGPKWEAAIDFADRQRTMLVGSVDFYHDNPGEYVKNPT